jgi:hypothetical protein
MTKIEIDLDDIEVERLDRYSSINKTSPEEAAKEMIQQSIDEWIESIDEDDGMDVGRH